MPKQSSKSLSESEWFKNPWTKLIGALTGAGLLVSIGYGFGDYRREVKCELEQIKQQQEFNLTLQNEINNCKEEKLVRVEARIEDLQELIKNVQERKNEK